MKSLSLLTGANTKRFVSIYPLVYFCSKVFFNANTIWEEYGLISSFLNRNNSVILLLGVFKDYMAYIDNRDIL